MRREIVCARDETTKESGLNSKLLAFVIYTETFFFTCMSEMLD